MTGKKKPRSVVERGFFCFPPGLCRQVKFVDESKNFPYFMEKYLGRILPKSVSSVKVRTRWAGRSFPVSGKRS